MVEFVQTTQPKVWDGFLKLHGPSAGAELVKRVAKVIDDRGTVDVLRHGSTITTCTTSALLTSAQPTGLPPSWRRATQPTHSRSSGRWPTSRRDLPTFVRLEVGDGDERCEIDLAIDHRALPSEPSDYGPTLAVEELAANTRSLRSSIRPNTTSSARSYKATLVDIARYTLCADDGSWFVAEEDCTSPRIRIPGETLS